MSTKEALYQQQEKLENANHIIGFISNALISWDTQRIEVIEQDLNVIADLLFESHKKIKEVALFLEGTAIVTKI